MGLPACVLDAKLAYRYANALYAAFVGRPVETLYGKSPAHAFDRQPADDRRKALARALAGETLTFDRRTFEGPNAGRWVRAHYAPIRLRGAVVGVAVVLSDIQHLKDAEERVRDQERQLRLITDSVGFPITYIGRDMIVRFANGPSLAWAGKARSEMEGRHYTTLAPAEVLAASQPLLDRAFAGESVTYEREALWTGRASRRIRGHMIPDRDEAGAVRGVLVVVIDIEDDYRLKQSLIESRRWLQLVSDNVGVPMAYIDADLRFRFANTPGLDWEPDIDPAHAVGRRLDEVYEPDVLRDVMPFLERALAGEKVVYERRGRVPGGKMRWIRVNLIPDKAADGTVAGLYSIVIDIDDDRRLREALERQERELRFYAENIPEAVAFVGPDLRYQWVNKGFENIRGERADSIIGRTVHEVLGEAARDFVEPFVERLRLGETCAYERLAGRAGGRGRWIRVRLVPLMDASGEFGGYYVVGTDIHEIKMAQEQLRAREEELRFFAENIPEAMVFVDLERGCTFVNNVFLATRGFTREWALGKFPEDVYPPEVMESLAPQIDRVKRGESASYERRIPIAGTGEERWVRVKLTPRKDAQGRVLGYYVVSNDVHDLKVAQSSLEAKEREMRHVIDSVPTPMVYVDAQLRYRYANAGFLRYIGRPAGEVIGRTVEEVLGEVRWKRLLPHVQRVMAGETVSFERLVEHADGKARWMVVRLTPRLDSQGRFAGYDSTTSDIHEQKSVEEELRRANNILSAHFDNTPLAVIEWDPQVRAIRWSGRSESLFGWKADEVLGRSLDTWNLVFEDDRAAVGSMVRRLMNGPDAHATILNRNYRKDGSVIWVEWHNSVLRDADGRLVSLLSLAQDVSSRIQAEERLQFMATHDGLTGLPNRLMLTERLATAMTRAHRFGHRVAVMFLDLDHFKDVNDTLGHRVGDELLRSLARRVRAALRQSDLLVRLSGDEFVVLLEDLEGDGGPDRVAQKILEDVMRPFPIEGHDVQVSASLGFAVYPEDGQDADTLLKNADAAMYHAKELGRNSYRAFSHALAQRRDERLGVEQALRRALKKDSFELHYQPILEVATGRVTHVESLLRWRDEKRGLVQPHAFIPLAEETGLMRDLGHWVLVAASTQAAAWRNAGIGNFIVSVNLSASQLRDSTIVSELEGIVTRTGCSPTWLELEITETSMVRDLEGVSLTLGKLRRMGFRIAIDDFGTGFSSLSHLRHLPVDTLKIDKSFVADIDGGRRGGLGGGAAIVAAVTGLARGLSLEVVAEGVERPEQLEFLKAHGCTAYQGYLACRPLPSAELEAWLAKGAPPALAKPASRAPRKKAVPAAAKKPTRR
ncbi:MAG: PAS domain-containing protein [Betaproteobacteria bacterium]|nr:PAS domain-containing protein [Betaproteobacteria bacterium]